LAPVARATGALTATRNLGFDTLIVDTAGRLHIADDLMQELEAIKAAVQPADLLYVADAMTGQDAVKSAGEFNHRIGTTGVVLTKMDGDARGGAALSVVGVVGVPIAFVGTGERLQDLEAFQADRLVSRMLGMGDVLSLIERAEEAIDDETRERLEKKTRLDDFTLDDFRDQLKTIKKMGPLEQVLGMIPGLGGLKQLNEQRAQVDDKQLAHVEAIVNSMTAKERRNHSLINGSRRKRIARGSGRSVEEVNRVLKQFVEMRKMLKVMSGAGGGRKGRQRLMGMLRGR
jgi:signal recognition particle subunit SRP54